MLCGEGGVVSHQESSGGGCFFTIDRNFMTPKLAVYMKKERKKHVRDGHKEEKHNVHRQGNAFVKKSVNMPRVFYNWSEDQVNGVTQCC